MINYIKEKIAYFIIEKRLKNNNSSGRSFSNFLNKTFTFLVIMPEEENDFQKSMEVLKYLNEKGKNITIFSYDFRRSLINQKFRPATIEYGLIDRTKLGCHQKEWPGSLKRKNLMQL